MYNAFSLKDNEFLEIPKKFSKVKLLCDTKCKFCVSDINLCKKYLNIDDLFFWGAESRIYCNGRGQYKDEGCDNNYNEAAEELNCETCIKHTYKKVHFPDCRKIIPNKIIHGVMFNTFSIKNVNKAIHDAKNKLLDWKADNINTNALNEQIIFKQDLNDYEEFCSVFIVANYSLKEPIEESFKIRFLN